jgi:hypothetical protein
MLASPEFEQIRLDYDERSRQFFPKAYRPPPELSFKDSPALFPDANLRARLEPEYEAECAALLRSELRELRPGARRFDGNSRTSLRHRLGPLPPPQRMIGPLSGSGASSKEPVTGAPSGT